MKDLISYLAKNITGTEEFTIEEEKMEGGFNYTIVLPQEYVGLVIGKGGQTIKSIRNLVKVRATLEKALINVSVKEKE